MRDGEQSPGASMSLDEKLELAKILEEMRVDVIEAGFPIASNGDFEAVREIAEIVTESTVCGLARAGVARHRALRRGDQAGQARPHPHLHLHQPAAPRTTCCSMEPDDVLELVTGSVTHARNLCGDVEWSAQDATRTERDFLRRCVEAAIRAGATHDQPAGHGGLHLSHRIRRDVPRPDRERAGRGRGGLLHPLPQRPGPGGRQQPGRRAGRGAAGGVRHQRHRRAGRQRGAGRDRHGAAGARRPAALRHRHRDRSTSPAPAATSRRSPASRCSSTRPSSARTPSPTRAASTRTGC